MNSAWRRPMAWGLFTVVCVCILALGSYEMRLGLLEGSDLLFAILPIVTAAAGLLIVNSRPDNSIGWLLMIWAVGTVLAFSTDSLATIAAPSAAGRPWLLLLLWVGGWSWILFVFPIFHLMQVFPTGRTLDGRWRWLMRLELGMAGIFVVLATFSQEFEYENVVVRNPIGLIGGAFWENLFSIPWTVGLSILALGGATSAIVRYRRAEAEERQQMKWLVFVVATLAIVYSLLAFQNAIDNTTLVDVVFAVSVTAVPVAIAVAVVRYRLYGIDLIISRAIVYGALGLFIAGVYGLVVLSAGAFAVILGAADPVYLAATSVVALAFQPIRRRMQKVADRIVYGRRATPYQVLSEFSRRLAANDEDLLQQVVQSLAAGTSAVSAAVWIKRGNAVERVAAWPAGEQEASPVALGSEVIPGADRTTWVSHEGERLGAISLTFSRGQQPTPLDERLLNEMASGMGLALRNLALTGNLRDRVEELRDSRRRIVAVQDQTRRRLERDLHDGAQQQLVALKVKLSLARRQAANAGAAQVLEVLDGLNAEAEGAIQSMRDIARGIFPPLLEAEGLEAALRAQVRQSAVPVTVEGSVGRYPPQVESTVYFCVLETLRNVARHARASSAQVTLRDDDGQLIFVVDDDGVGFDPATTPPGNGLTNLADRLDAVVGRLDVRSAPGQGTTITGTVPVHPLVPA